MIYNNLNIHYHIMIQIVPDSCLVIEMIKQGGISGKLRSQLKGKPIRWTLCDVVLTESARITGLDKEEIRRRISRMVGRDVETLLLSDEERQIGKSITEQYAFCHKGDNFILAFCLVRSFILLTFDRMLLNASSIVGVPAFHPRRAGGI